MNEKVRGRGRFAIIGRKGSSEFKLQNHSRKMKEKELYVSPACEILELNPEGVIAASGGLGDDKYEKEVW